MPRSFLLSARTAIRILVNPSSARGRSSRNLAAIEKLARRRGVRLQVSTSREDLRAAARRAVADGVERLVVVGGDGSMHLAAQELAGSECALAPIAAGRGNDLAICVGSTGGLLPALEYALEGPVRSIDCGRAGEVVFVVHCGVGFDSEAARWANRQRWVKGLLAYPLAALRTILDFVPPRLRIEYQGGVFEDQAMFVVCANCWRFGGGMKIAPDASLQDGLLDVVIVRRVPRAALLSLLPRVYLGRHIDHPAVEIIKTPWVRISIDRRMEMHGDGEAMLWLGSEPVDVHIEPAALKVVGGPVLARGSSGPPDRASGNNLMNQLPPSEGRFEC